MSLLIRNGRVVDPAGGTDAVADVLIADGRIQKVGRALKAPEVAMAAEDLRLAMRAIGRITGTVRIDELLDVIFRDFCIGK